MVQSGINRLEYLRNLLLSVIEHGQKISQSRQSLGPSVLPLKSGQHIPVRCEGKAPCLNLTRDRRVRSADVDQIAYLILRQRTLALGEDYEGCQEHAAQQWKHHHF